MKVTYPFGEAISFVQDDRDWQKGVAETSEQRMLVAILRRAKVQLHAVPNGGLRSSDVAGGLKAEGVSPGVPDLLLWGQVGTDAPCVALEMKRLNGKTTDVSYEQQMWLRWMATKGWVAAVSCGAEPAISFLKKIGYTF